MTAAVSQAHAPRPGCPAGWSTSSTAPGHRARTARPSASPTRSATRPTRRWPQAAPRMSTARRGRAPRVHRRAVARPGGPPAGAGTEPDRGRHRAARRAHRRAGDLRHRPADHTGPRPGGTGGRELPLLRRHDRGPARGRVPDRHVAARLRDPQAGRRGRADHALEHPVHAGNLEARAEPGRRVPGDPQARGMVTAVGEPAARDHDRGGRPRRRVQHGARHRRGRRRGPGDAPAGARGSRSPARRRPGRSSWPRPRRASRGCRWSWAASPPASCSPTPISTRPRTAPCSGCSR